MRRAQSTGSIQSNNKGENERRATRDYWREFCIGTPIHGVKHLVDTNRPLYERLWWTGVLMTSLYFATAYSLELWTRLRTRPSNYNIQSVTRYEDIKQVPFPAITFCDNMKSVHPNLTKNETTSFLCGQLDDSPAIQTHQISVGTLKKMAPPFRRSCILYHNQLDEKQDYFSFCEKMFTMILTQHGVCYTFNMLQKSEIFPDGVRNYYTSHGRRSDWEPEAGYMEGAAIADGNGTDDPFRLGPYPKRANSWILSLQLWPGTHGTFCQDDIPGFKVAVHNPTDVPRMGHHDNVWAELTDGKFEENDFMKIDLGNEYSIDVDPEENWTDEVLRNIESDQRRCYFKGEKNLSYFKYFTETNCENECLINVTLEACRCVDFYMPHHNGTEICSNRHLDCVMESIEWWKKRGKRVCGCYPPCKDLKYSSKLYIRRQPQPQTRYKKKESIKLMVYISDNQYISKEQKNVRPSYFLVDFLANCGGVFGLFCGMSIVSLVELGYFATIRLVTNRIRKRKKEHPQFAPN